MINGLLNQFWRIRESPKLSVPYRLKWEPAYCISVMFVLWIPLWVYVFFFPHHVVFSCEMCFINDLPRLHVSFEMLWQNLFSIECKRRKNVIFKRQTFFHRGLADFISGALLFSFHSLGFEATIKPYVWYCVMWFRPREKQSFIFKENPIFPNELIITNRIVEIYG